MTKIVKTTGTLIDLKSYLKLMEKHNLTSLATPDGFIIHRPSVPSQLLPKSLMPKKEIHHKQQSEAQDLKFPNQIDLDNDPEYLNWQISGASNLIKR